MRSIDEYNARLKHYQYKLQAHMDNVHMTNIAPYKIWQTQETSEYPVPLILTEQEIAEEVLAGNVTLEVIAGVVNDVPKERVSYGFFDGKFVRIIGTEYAKLDRDKKRKMQEELDQIAAMQEQMKRKMDEVTYSVGTGSAMQEKSLKDRIINKIWYW